MKTSATVGYGALAAISLIAAYFTWQKPKTAIVEEKVTVIEATANSLQKVRYEDGTRFLELTQVHEPSKRTWITAGALAGKEVVDAGMATVTLDAGVDGGAPMLTTVKPPAPTPTRKMHGNERADGVFARFTPFDVTRALGNQITEEKKKELGLTDSPRRLEITVAGTTRSFVISRPAQGMLSTYAQDVKTNDVYLLPGTLIAELEPASQALIERRPHAFRQAEFDRLKITVDGKSVEYDQRDAEISATVKLSKPSSPDKTDELAKNWHEKMWSRLIVTEVLGEGETPKNGLPEVALRIDYTQRSREKGWLEIGFDKTKGTWMRSENLANWVAVNQSAEEWVTEAKRMVAQP